MNEIGILIYNRRKELGLTLEEVGNAVGVSKSTVKKWEDGFISNMRRDKIEKLAKILRISPVRLLGITPEKEKTAPADGESDSSVDIAALLETARPRSEWREIIGQLSRENKIKLLEYARLLLLSQAREHPEGQE